MASLTETLKRAVGKMPDVPALELDIAQAGDHIARLEASRASIRLEIFAGTPGAEKRMKDLDAEVATLQAKIADLALLREGTLERQSEIEKAARAEYRKTQLRSVTAHLATATDAAKRVEDATKALAEANRDLHIAVEKAQHVAGSLWPISGLSDLEIVRLVGAEAYRHVNPIGGNGEFANADRRFQLPGAVEGSLEQRQDPTRGPAIGEVVAKNCAEVKEAIRRALKVSE